MDTKISGLKNTVMLLDEIEKELSGLEQALVSKRQRIQTLRQAAGESVAQIDSLVKQLDKVLENDGSGNGSN